MDGHYVFSVESFARFANPQTAKAGQPNGVVVEGGTIIAAPTLEALGKDSDNLIKFLTALSPEFTVADKDDAVLVPALELVSNLVRSAPQCHTSMQDAKHTVPT